MCTEDLFGDDYDGKYGPWHNLLWFFELFYHEEGEAYEDYATEELFVKSPRNFITFSKPDYYADAYSWNLSQKWIDGEYEIVHFEYGDFEPYAPNFPSFLFRQTLEMIRDCDSHSIDACLKCIQCLDCFADDYGELAKLLFTQYQRSMNWDSYKAEVKLHFPERYWETR